jgi:hypothetical protein
MILLGEPVHFGADADHEHLGARQGESADAS